MKYRNYPSPFAITLLLLITSIAFGSYTGNQRHSEFDNEAITFNTSEEISPFDNTNGKLITICGTRRVSLQQVSLYHCIIFYPKGRFELQANKTSSDGRVSTLTDTWKLQKSRLRGQKNAHEGTITIRYDTINKSVSIGSEEYRIAKGNLFVVRWDEKGSVQAKQVLATLDECLDAEEVLGFYKKVLPDREIKKLKLM